jgi:hypothetical protein
VTGAGLRRWLTGGRLLVGTVITVLALVVMVVVVSGGGGGVTGYYVGLGRFWPIKRGQIAHFGLGELNRGERDTLACFFFGT